MVTRVQWQTGIRHTSIRGLSEWDSLKIDKDSKTARGEPSTEGAEFYSVFRESIFDVIGAVFGEGGTKALLFHLQLEQYGHRSKEFSDRLHVIFKEGALTLEKLIVKELYRRVSLPYEETMDFDFERCAKLAEQAVLKRTPGREHGRS